MARLNEAANAYLSQEATEKACQSKAGTTLSPVVVARVNWKPKRGTWLRQWHHRRSKRQRITRDRQRRGKMAYSLFPAAMLASLWYCPEDDPRKTKSSYSN